jgi:DNA-binding CsgD family transcriptional regulator
MTAMEARLAALLGDFTTSIDDFEAGALRHLSAFFECDAAFFATIGPKFVERSPPYFQRILADPQRFDPDQKKAQQIVARFGTAFIDTEAYSAEERDRLPIFRELLRPAGISSVVLAIVNLDGRTTGMLHLVRDGRPFDGAKLAEARPLFRAISIMHHALVGAPESARPAPPDASREILGRLTPREYQVAELAADGYGALQIAARFGTSVNTVRRQLESIHRKCGIGNRAELTTLIQRVRLNTELSARASGSPAGLIHILESVKFRPAVRAP